MITLKKACAADTEQIWKMQVESFSALLEKYRDFETNPASEPQEKVKARLLQPFTYYYLIMDDDIAVGAIRVTDKKETEERKRISPIFILPQYRGKGYAKAAILQAEHIHGAENWALDTILQENVLCRFYEKLGYRDTGKRERINEKMTLIFYEK